MDCTLACRGKRTKGWQNYIPAIRCWDEVKHMITSKILVSTSATLKADINIQTEMNGVLPIPTSKFSKFSLPQCFQILGILAYPNISSPIKMLSPYTSISQPVTNCVALINFLLWCIPPGSWMTYCTQIYRYVQVIDVITIPLPTPWKASKNTILCDRCDCFFCTSWYICYITLLP